MFFFMKKYCILRRFCFRFVFYAVCSINVFLLNAIVKSYIEVEKIDFYVDSFIVSFTNGISRFLQ